MYLKGTLWESKPHTAAKDRQEGVWPLSHWLALAGGYHFEFGALGDS